MTTRVYSTGTVAVAADKRTVTLSGGAWTSLNAATSSLIVINGSFNFVNTLTDTTHLVLQIDYTGTVPASGLSYAIYPLTADEVATYTANQRLATLLSRLALAPQGVPLYMDGSGITDQDPGSGFVRFNSTTNPTWAYISKTDSLGNNIAGRLATLAASVNATSRAVLQFIPADGSNIYIDFDVTGALVDGTTYYKVPVAMRAGAVPAANAQLAMTGVPSGADGTAGANGVFSAIASQASAIAGTDNTNGLTPLRLRQVLDGSPLSGLRNKVLNGDFNIWQQGISVVTAGFAYSADQWVNARDGSGATVTISRSAHVLGQVNVPGNPKYYGTFAQSVAGSGGTINQLVQRLEGVGACSGKTVTLTFYAKADAARIVGIGLYQFFGSGGSPSTAIQLSGTSVSLTTAWQNFTQTIAVPSIAGKALGSNGDDSLFLQFVLPTNTMMTIDFSRVSLVEGDATAEADPFSQRPSELEMMLCQRYFRRSNGPFSGNLNATGLVAAVNFQPPMRVGPAVILNTAGSISDGVTAYTPTTATINGTSNTDGLRVQFAAASTTAGRCGVTNGTIVDFDARL